MSPLLCYRLLSSVSGNDLTIESISKLLDQKLAPSSSAMSDLRNSIVKEVRSLISAEISHIIRELKEEFTQSTDFIMEEVKELKATIAQKDAVIGSLQTEQSQLKDELKLIRSRFSVMENLSRGRNVELHCVPERSNENVVSMFKALCETVQLPMSDSDIHACRRVAKMDTPSKRPRSIVVTLTSPRLRDSLISAVSRYNKDNKQKKLNTNHMGLAGESHQIYISEHLSPECKQLYAAARRFAKDQNYAYCWVKYGQIYLRKADNTGVILV